MIDYLTTTSHRNEAMKNRDVAHELFIVKLAVGMLAYITARAEQAVQIVFDLFKLGVAMFDKIEKAHW